MSDVRTCGRHSRAMGDANLGRTRPRRSSFSGHLGPDRHRRPSSVVLQASHRSPRCHASYLWGARVLASIDMTARARRFAPDTRGRSADPKRRVTTHGLARLRQWRHASADPAPVPGCAPHVQRRARTCVRTAEHGAPHAVRDLPHLRASDGERCRRERSRHDPRSAPRGSIQLPRASAHVPRR